MVVIILVWVKTTSQLTENSCNHHEKTTCHFHRFLAILYRFSKGNTFNLEGSGLGGAICYRPEAMSGGCSF